MRIFALLLASLLCVGIARSGLRGTLEEPEKKDALKMVTVDKDVKDHQATRAETKDDLKTETNVEAEDEDDEDDEEPAAEPQLLLTGENETNVEAEDEDDDLIIFEDLEDEDDEDDEDAWWQRHCRVCAKARYWRRCLGACRRWAYQKRARQGVYALMNHGRTGSCVKKEATKITRSEAGGPKFTGYRRTGSCALWREQPKGTLAETERGSGYRSGQSDRCLEVQTKNGQQVAVRTLCKYLSFSGANKWTFKKGGPGQGSKWCLKATYQKGDGVPLRNAGLPETEACFETVIGWERGT